MESRNPSAYCTEFQCLCCQSYLANCYCTRQINSPQNFKCKNTFPSYMKYFRGRGGEERRGRKDCNPISSHEIISKLCNFRLMRKFFDISKFPNQDTSTEILLKGLITEVIFRMRNRERKPWWEIRLDFLRVFPRVNTWTQERGWNLITTLQKIARREIRKM